MIEFSSEFLGTQEAAGVLHVDRVTVFRWAKDYPGFAAKLNGRWRVPAEHVQRMQMGETAQVIAESPASVMRPIAAGNVPKAAPRIAETIPDWISATAPEELPADGISDAARAGARDRIIRSFIFAKALHLHDDLATDRRLAVLTDLADELLAALTDLGLMQGDLREMILQTDACAAYHRISGFPVEV